MSDKAMIRSGIIILFFSFILFGIYRIYNSIVENIDDFTTPATIIHQTMTPSHPNIEKSISFDGQPYSVEYYQVKSTENVILIPNFKEQKTATTVKAEYNCNFVTNGGFYDKKNKPIGLFRTDSTVYGNETQNLTFNGFLWKSNDESYSMAPEYTDAHSEWAIQSGPLLIENNSPQTLSIRNDESARRSVAARTREGHLIFLSIYGTEQITSGPYLADLPAVVSEANQKFNLHIDAAINLDGGTASAFISKHINIGELQTVGSFFCVK